jgi:hypothetical protein
VHVRVRRWNAPIDSGRTRTRALGDRARAIGEPFERLHEQPPEGVHSLRGIDVPRDGQFERIGIGRGVTQERAIVAAVQLSFKIAEIPFTQRCAGKTRAPDPASRP